MRETFPMLDFGLYRDDGLASHKRIPGPTLDKMKKDIIQLFKKNGLTITIETGMKIVDFLDITLDLAKENYKPYKKPNSELLYVNNKSNHPQSVLKHIPNSVNQRLINISSDIHVFEEAKGEYQRALSNSGYNQELVYPENGREIEPSSERNRTRRNRKRNIVWYNPPYNCSLKRILVNNS